MSTFALLLPFLLGGAVVAHWALGARRASAQIENFFSRWKPRAKLVLPCQVWQGLQHRPGAVALTTEHLVFRAARTHADVEVPLALLGGAAVREGPGGRTLVDLSLPGGGVFLEVAPEFVDEVVASIQQTIAGR